MIDVTCLLVFWIACAIIASMLVVVIAYKGDPRFNHIWAMAAGYAMLTAQIAAVTTYGLSPRHPVCVGVVLCGEGLILYGLAWMIVKGVNRRMEELAKRRRK